MDKANQTDSIDVEINNSNTINHKIATLYAERLMNDICLVVNGTDYPAHRLILCASSDVFQVMLMNPQWSESQKNRVVLQETEKCAKVFGQFLKYLYTGCVRINHEVVVSLLMLADKYNVKDLIALCVQYMCNHIPHAAINNQLISWLQYTKCCGHTQVSKDCKNFVKWNFDLIEESDDFGNLDVYVLVSFLKKNDLVVHNEMFLFNSVVKWLSIQEIRWQNIGTHPDEVMAHMQELVPEVMEFIRFPMMSPRQLAQLLLIPLVLQHRDFFVDKMAMAMAYHSGQLRSEKIKRALGTEKGRLQFTPRLYTAYRWSTILSVENFNLLQPYHTRTLMFSSHCTIQECLGEHSCEWILEIFPKGVWFRKCLLIVWQGTVEVPEQVLRTVRLAITCKDLPPSGEMYAKVGVLIRSVKDGVEHISSVVQKIHRFNKENRLINFDDLIPFDELNRFAGPASSVFQPPASLPPEPFLVGSNRDTLQLHIVIAPLNDLCRL